MEHINRIIELVIQNPWIVFLSLLFGFVSVIVTGYVLWRDRNKRVKLVYSVATTNVISIDTTIKDLQIAYKGERINTLSVSEVTIWNQGRIPIYRKDMPMSESIEIVSFDGFEIIDSEFEFIKESLNNYRIDSISRNSIKIDFDFIDHMEGLVVKVFHTGLTPYDLAVRGKIIGSEKIDRIILSTPKSNRFSFLFTLAIGFIGLVIALSFSNFATWKIVVFLAFYVLGSGLSAFGPSKEHDPFRRQKKIN